MKTIKLGTSTLTASRIAYGCMRIGGSWDGAALSKETVRAAAASVAAALECGITLFDHADIYARGKSEEAFAAAMREMPEVRERIILQSKCGIRFAGDPDPSAPARYDFSRKHIVRSADGILRRLKTEYLDILLLHRPDALVEPEEVAAAFSELSDCGKVRWFGVSNHTGAQIDLLKRYVEQPLIVNQIELSVTHAHLIDEGIVFNQDRPEHPVRNHGTLEYCRLHDITLQPWSPLAGGGVGSKKDARVENVNTIAGTIAARAGVSIEAVWIAWILRHPAQMQPVLGATNPEHIKAASAADGIELTREEWYALFAAGRGAGIP